ncbi:hypothetical protein MLD38_015365 [Melastoma candidum]|uniref:Uncharacterized protein n=1 Tax=Melastoma candidum TaxID=119954 RepID=A0ACB9RFH3_9MYRT|nr:hypothetical protein MLD38_015365 [Melastoma candidum]
MSAASLQEVLRLFAALASRLDSIRPSSAIESAGDEVLDGLISNLNCSLNLGGDQDDPTIRILDAALSLSCFDPTKVFDSVVECTVETIVAVLSSIGCKVIAHGKGEALSVGGSIQRCDSEAVILACVDILCKLRKDGRLVKLLLCAVAEASVSASHCQYLVPSTPVIDWQGVNERSIAASKLLDYLPQEIWVENCQIPLRIFFWYLDPLILRDDVSDILQETIEKPFLCLEKELQERPAWRNFVVCLVLSPPMFIQTRALLHSWFLQTGRESVLKFLITLVSAILDAISMPIQWGISMETVFKVPFSDAYFPFNHDMLRILAGPISSTQFSHLTNYIIANKMKSKFARLPGKTNLVDHQSMWALAVDFPLWFYLATAFLFCGHSFLQNRNLGLQPDLNEKLKNGILSSSSAAAVSYISWTFSPDNSRTEEIVSGFLVRSAESWTVKQSSSLKDEKVAGYVKKSKKPKYHHCKNDFKPKGAVGCQSIALWLEEFQKQMFECLGIEKCMLLMKVPLGILLGWSGDMEDGVPEMLLHYASTGQVLLSSDSGTDALDNNVQGSMTGALLVFQLTDIVEFLSESLFEDEESGLAFICRFKERTREYLVKCVKRLIHFQVHEQGSQFLSDLLLRLLRWKSQARELPILEDFNQLLSLLNNNLSSTRGQ